MLQLSPGMRPPAARSHPDILRVRNRRMDDPLLGTRYHPRLAPRCWQGGELLIILRALALFIITAVAEILGCYLTFGVLRQGRSPLLLAPAALSLAAFACLLTLHPTGAARTYAAYGGVYVVVAGLWLWLIEGQRPTHWDVAGGCIALLGMAVILFGPGRAR